VGVFHDPISPIRTYWETIYYFMYAYGLHISIGYYGKVAANTVMCSAVDDDIASMYEIGGSLDNNNTKECIRSAELHIVH
jgi:hypothetical protein